MKKAIVGALLLGAVVVTAPFVLGLVPGDAEPVEEGEVTIDQVPAAVKATILAEAAGNTIEEIEEETEDGVVTYEAEWHEGDTEIEIKVAPDGTLLEREVEEEDDDDDDVEHEDGDDDDDEDEEEVTIDQVPAAVKATILEQAAGNTIEEIEEETENGVVTYEAEWQQDGKEIEIKVAADGKLLEREVDDDDDDDDDD